MSEEFDWSASGLDERWWIENGTSIGANRKQAMFAAAKHAGKSNTEAARESGYGAGSDDAARAEGYRVFRSNRIQELLALAAAESGGDSKGDITPAEAKQILSKLARGSDPQIKIKALDSLAKMAEAEKASAAEESPTDPIQSIAELCATNALMAGFIVANNNVRPTPDFIAQAFPAAALAATRGSSITAAWSRGFVDEIAEKLGIKLNAVQATKQETGNGHGAA